VPRGGTPLPDAELRGPLAVVLGAEGAGLPEAIVEDASARVTIPMRPPVESFNVAITAALILYEAAKQRA
jgi:tRNA G18 (ribose-2'-O)-methylase SpoU